ncbi:MAG: metal-dependent transcriptional regulator [Propioniciclava sp.]|uniref:metal-dependent transcriptional regulator n=1 Tax=Propioniciclava sp. TaxID=2038686 RepID=UPI0039E52EEC
MSDLIDTTEMYLRTVFELEEEGIAPLRARIAERLSQSGPTVSQTVQRMERDGLLWVANDRQIVLTASGREKATSVMRKHRLAEVLLTEVIGVPLDLVHAEACRWEHVISDAVEQRLMELLNAPATSPYGNPIPGQGAVRPRPAADDGLLALPDALHGEDAAEVILERIGEVLQNDPPAMAALVAASITPGASFSAQRVARRVRLEASGHEHWLPVEAAAHLFVRLA